MAHQHPAERECLHCDPRGNRSMRLVAVRGRAHDGTAVAVFQCQRCRRLRSELHAGNPAPMPAAARLLQVAPRPTTSAVPAAPGPRTQAAPPPPARHRPDRRRRDGRVGVGTVDA